MAHVLRAPRYALVIGAGAYAGGASLGMNPINDATDMAEQLTSKAGFSRQNVDLLINPKT